MCEGVSYLVPLLKEAYSYEYSDEPQYGKLIFMLEFELLNMNCLPDKYFSWFNNLLSLKIKNCGFINNIFIK